MVLSITQVFFYIFLHTLDYYIYFALNHCITWPYISICFYLIVYQECPRFSPVLILWIFFNFLHHYSYCSLTISIQHPLNSDLLWQLFCIPSSTFKSRRSKQGNLNVDNSTYSRRSTTLQPTFQTIQCRLSSLLYLCIRWVCQPYLLTRSHICQISGLK